jgi:hypothetical protein
MEKMMRAGRTNTLNHPLLLFLLGIMGISFEKTRLGSPFGGQKASRYFFNLA